MSRSDLSAVADLSASERELIANHSNAWQLATVAALPDAYLTYLVPDGAVESEITWKSGVVESRLRLDGSTVMRIAEDVPNVYSWDARSWEYDPVTGQLDRRITRYDNGRTQIDTYNELGARIERVQVDTPSEGEEVSSFKTFSYQPNGKMGTIFIRKEDGREITITYDETGQKTGELHVDVADAFGWAVRSENFNAEGKHTSVLQIDDDGMQYLWTYNGRGEVIEKTYDDFGDRWSWEQRHWRYDDDGQIQAHRVTQDDGVVVEVAFENGQRTTETSIDTADTFVWETDVTEYDPETGQALRRQRVEDDGDWEEWRFDETGATRAYFREDVSDRRAWETQQVEYDRDGGVSYRRQVDDGGEVSETGIASADPFLSEDYALLT